MHQSIKQILIHQDGLTEAEANSLIEEAREALSTYIAKGDLENAENICEEYFNLEPDYLMELL